MSERFSDRMRKQRADVILRETTNLLAEQGCCELRVEDVARRAGVAKGTIYLDFQSKEHLVSTALEHAAEQMLSELRSRTAARQADALGAAVEYLAGLHAERPALTALLDRRALCSASQEELATMPAAQLESVLADMIREAARAGRIDRAIEPELAAYAAVSLAQAPLLRSIPDGADRAHRAIAHAVGLAVAESGKRAEGAH